MNVDKQAQREEFETEYFEDHIRLFRPEIHPENPLNERILDLTFFWLKVAGVILGLIAIRFFFISGMSMIFKAIWFGAICSAFIVTPLYLFSIVRLSRRHKKHQIANLKDVELLEQYNQQQLDCERFIEKRMSEV